MILLAIVLIISAHSQESTSKKSSLLLITCGGSHTQFMTTMVILILSTLGYSILHRQELRLKAKPEEKGPSSPQFDNNVLHTGNKLSDDNDAIPEST